MDEIVDIVDENDNLIGQGLKSKCHKEGICHRSAAVICFNNDNFEKILITRRSMNMQNKPGLLCIPGGHLNVNETYLEGGLREFNEEVMVNQEINLELEPLFKLKKTTDDDHEFLQIFKAVHAGPFNFDPYEISEIYFEDTEKILIEIDEEPEKYIETFVLVLNEYRKRYLCQK